MQGCNSSIVSTGTGSVNESRASRSKPHSPQVGLYSDPANYGALGKVPHNAKAPGAD
jgi:hypothetical protein